MNNAVRRPFLYLVIQLSLLFWEARPSPAGDSFGTKPLAEPFDYAANVANGDVALGARIVPRKEVRKVFQDRLFPNGHLLRLSRDFTIVEVGVFPLGEQPVGISLEAFRLLSGPHPVAALQPEDVVFELIHGRPRDGPIGLAKKSNKKGRGSLHKAAMNAALFLNGLQEAKTDEPRAGLVYFPMKRKEWKGAESLVVEYALGENTIKLILPVSP